MSKAKYRFSILSLIVLFILIWHFGVVLFHVPNYIIPAPLTLIDYMVNFFRTGDLTPHILVTLKEVFVGTFFGILLGMVLGYLIAKVEVFDKLITPILLIMQISPKISIAPLFILWFGLGLESKVALVILVVSFPIMLNESTAIKNVDTSYRDFLSIMNANKWQVFYYLELPSALREVISGIKVAVTQAITSAVIGEMMGAKQGLGYLLTNGSELYDINMILTAIIILSFIGVVLYYFFDWLEGKLLYWE